MINQRQIDVIGSSTAATALPSSYDATAKLAIATGGVDKIDFNLYFTASAANSTLEWKYEFSDDGTNYYGEDASSVSDSTVTHSASGVSHQWTPGSAAAHLKNVQLNGLNCQWIRVSAHYVTSGGTLWMEALLNEELS